GRGIGRQLLLWGMRYIRSKNDFPILLHVAAWNKKAVQLYESVGFTITKTEIIVS
ncbi:MAG: GNAT family N-acetyltransferase, partial [Clostridia bacterium]|nr:GNAT family N-acetyltransferase [Clostridia bacterium]